jgi:hypothetical protein
MKEGFYTKPPQTPIKDVLEPEVQVYIEENFPQTNDDNLQEDLAYKFVTDSNYLDKLHENQNIVKDIERDAVGALEKALKYKLKLGAQLQMHQDLNERVARLLNKLKNMDLKPSQHKGINTGTVELNNPPIAHLFERQIEDIKKELHTIKNEKIGPLSVGELLEQYNEATERYNTLNNILKNSEPELN